jgi:hypothetical protein
VTVVNLVDVRSIPRSRRNPQFEQKPLFAALQAAGIGAIGRKGLGGRRPARKDSINDGWRNASFRGYADYMQTQVFSEEIDWLMGLPHFEAVAVMCAEAVPSIPDRGFRGGTWRLGRGHLCSGERNEHAEATSHDAFCPGGGRAGLVSLDRSRVSLVCSIKRGTGCILS